MSSRLQIFQRLETNSVREFRNQLRHTTKRVLAVDNIASMRKFISDIVESCGGAIVQDPASPIVHGMPRATLAAAGSDRVVAPGLVASAVSGLLSTRSAGA